MQDEDKKIIVGALKGCASKEKLGEVFGLFNITDKAVMIGKLNDCMGNPQTFFSSGDIPVEDEYELTVQMFLTGSWKTAAYYEQLGFGK